MNWANYDDVLAQMLAAGLEVDSLEVGRMQRCKVAGDRERRGWYSLHELQLDAGPDGGLGDTVLVGTFGRWQGAENNATKIELKRRKLTADQRQAMKIRIDQDRKAADAARKRSAERAAAQAQRAWAACTHEGESDYLKRKGVAGHGVRYSPKGALVIPMLDAGGAVHGLQVIHAKPKHGRDKDYWPAGLAKQGHFFLLGPTPAWLLLVGEGYATCASVFEATGHPIAVAFDAGNLQATALALRRRYPRARILIIADDDYLTDGNPGITKASSAALAVKGAWLAPSFELDREGKKITDFNDLHLREGLHCVRAQVEAKLRQLQWQPEVAAAASHTNSGEGVAAPSEAELRPIESPVELHDRFSLVYELPDVVFDGQESKLVPLSSMRNACTNRGIVRQWMESVYKRIVRVREVGFDPSGQDPLIKCNLWGGWPTRPKPGACDQLLELLYYLCSGEPQAAEVYDWVLKWLAYPIQHPGAKMRTALVFHGPQGVGKNMFFEAVMAIYGEYGRIIDQGAIEDKFNDWASRKLFMIANEVVARMELFHVKNKLKGLITDEWVRVNPKNMSAYDERNHMNLVFLSNETQPIVLERDDRRYTIVWTPPKMDPAFYEAVRVEIQSGGIEALHEHLLNLPLGDFKPWTGPPMTQAKADLLEISLDSTERFWGDWIGRMVPLTLTPARSEDLYEAYRYWCSKQGIGKPAQMSTFTGNCTKRPGAFKMRRRHYLPQSSATAQSTVLYPPGVDTDQEMQLLSDQLAGFKESVRAWKGADYRGTAADG